METSNSGITKKVTKGEVKLERLYTNKYQKEGTQTAEFKQTVRTQSTYPSKSVSNSLQDNLFDPIKDFGFKGKEYDTTSTRVAWLDVPAGLTEEKVTEIVTGRDVTIRQILSNHPIISDTQEYAIKANLTTKDKIAASQILRYPQGSDNEGQIILDSTTGKPVYRVNVFKLGKVEDIDNKNGDPSDYYISEDLKKEIDSYSEAEAASGDSSLFNG